MKGAELFFWILAGTVFYSYFGYGLVLLLLSIFRNRKQKTQTANQPLTIVVPCYNEGQIIKTKLANTLNLQYPANQKNIIFITDGSTDGSNDILRGFPVLLIDRKQRLGKASAINAAMQQVDTPVVVFTDANTQLNNDALVNLMQHFADPAVGAVAGEKKVLHHSGMGTAEGIYWKYESLMKELDAQFYSVSGAAGELFAMRSDLFQPLPEDTILDDLQLSLSICMQGYRIAYERAAYAIEIPSATLHDEKARKVRIATGAFQLLSRLSFKQLFGFPRFAWQFITRRWLRWVFCPPALIIALLLHAFLAVNDAGSFYTWTFMLHLAFYLFGFIGWILIRSNKAVTIFTIPFYFLFMNFCMLLGWVRFRQGKNTVLWKKAARQFE